MGSPPDWIVYIDESGDEGIRFGKGSSDWFVLGAAIFARESERACVEVVSDVRRGINRVQSDAGRKIPEKKALHFRDLKHEQKKFYCATIAQAEADLLAVAVHKPTLAEMAAMRGRSELFFWTSGHLLAAVAVRFAAAGLDQESVEFCFSNRSGITQTELAARLGSSSHHELTGTRAWSRFEVTLIPHSKRAGLQIADAVASSFFASLQLNAFGQVEDGYVKILGERRNRLVSGPGFSDLLVLPPGALEKEKR